jgi:glycosyltransferase involved in cell wall biosynthesis
MYGLVSIIIPTKNRLALLKETLTSIKAQTFPNWEALIVDDGSDDETLEWMAAARKEDKRLRLINRAAVHPKTGGAQVCRNIGWQVADGVYVLFLDSDDLLAPDCVWRRINILNERPELDFVVGQCGMFRQTPGDTPDIWSDWQEGQDDLDAFLANKIPWQTSGPLWRRSALERVGPWDEELVHVGHDHEFHVRALCRHLKYVKLPVVDYFWRAPRRDSLSSFDSFKAHHANGGMLLVYLHIVDAVCSTGEDTPPRKELLIKEALRLGICCRLFDGDFRTSVTGIRAVRARGWLGTRRALEILTAFRCWFRVFGHVPALTWLNRRFS